MEDEAERKMRIFIEDSLEDKYACIQLGSYKCKWSNTKIFVFISTKIRRLASYKIHLHFHAFLVDFLAEDFAADFVAEALVVEALVGVFAMDLTAETLDALAFTAEVFPTLALVGVTDLLAGVGLLEADLLLVADFLAEVLVRGLLERSRVTDLLADLVAEDITLACLFVLIWIFSIIWCLIILKFTFLDDGLSSVEHSIKAKSTLLRQRAWI